MPATPIAIDPSRQLQRYVLAIDLGSGGHKAAIVSDTGEVIASASEPLATQMLPDGGAEQDPIQWWDGARKTAKEAIEQSGVAPRDIVAVGCDSQWSVVVAVDENCEPLMNAVHWLDTRGGKYNRRISAGFPQIRRYNLFKLFKWLKLTGLVPTHSGVDSLGHVLYIKNEHPQIYDRTFKFLEPMDYLTSRLTGRITGTQKTMAIFMVVDNRRWGCQNYHDDLLQMAGVAKEKFPDLIPNDGVVGPLAPAVADDLGLLPSTPVIAGIGDSNASAIGSGTVQDYDATIYIGTSYYINCHVPFKKTDINHMIGSLPSPFKDTFILLAEQGTGGRCLEFYLKNLVYPQDDFATAMMPEDAYERLNKMAGDTPAGSDGVIFLPWLNGSIAPSENPYMRGGFMNLSLNTTRAHMARAIMEGLAFNSRWTHAAAQKFIGRSIDSYRFSGGGALSSVWSQIHADILGVPVHQVDDPVNTTVRGTAMLALITLGYRTAEEIQALVKVRQVFEPDAAGRELYERMYAQYRNFFKKSKKIYAALNADKGL